MSYRVTMADEAKPYEAAGHYDMLATRLHDAADVDGHITLGCREDGADAVIFYVEDTGKGIPEASLPYIYDRFYKVDEFIQGAGLGLSLVQILTRLLQGKILVTSKEGEGTRFEVRLPREMR